MPHWNIPVKLIACVIANPTFPPNVSKTIYINRTLVLKQFVTISYEEKAESYQGGVNNAMEIQPEAESLIATQEHIKS